VFDHVAIRSSRDAVDHFWQVGMEAGYPSDGEPGPRPQYGSDYYGSFLLDPDGNSVEAVCHEDTRRGGNVDHLWIGVTDLDATFALDPAGTNVESVFRDPAARS
jgi:hypothetical protein